VSNYGLWPRADARLKQPGAAGSLEAGRPVTFGHTYSRLRSTASAIAIAVGLLTAAGTSSAAAQTFDRFIVIQPVQVCDNAGNNCALVDYRQAATAEALKQAGVLPIFLPLNQINDSARLAANAGPASFADGDGGSADPTVINMWFTAANSITSCGGATPPPGRIYTGCAGGKEAVINGPWSANNATDNGLDHNLIAHELGHDLGLGHNNGATNLMDPTTQTGQFSAIGNTTFLLNATEIATIQGNGNVHATPADLNGGAGTDGLTLGAGNAALNIFAQGGADQIILQAGSGVLQNVQGDAGNDQIIVASGSIVGNNVDGGADNDTIQIGGLVMNDVLGGSGNDTIGLLSTAEVIHNVDGGDGDDTISVAGKVAAGQFQPFSASRVATVSSPTQIRGGQGSDAIILGNGALVAGSVLGGDGSDAITMRVGASIAGDINGEGGDDTITISGGEIAQFTDGVGGPISGGNVLGGGGSDTITMTGGRVAGNVDGQDGADQFSIQGGTVFGNVLGGGDNDVITVSSGNVIGNVDGQDGADQISIQGGMVNGLVHGNGGNDTIFLLGGQVGGGVNGESGEDIITLNGSTVFSGIWGGNGNDTISLLSGSAGFVRGDSGADAITLNGATILAAISGGSGNDTISLLSGSARSVSGDGGDDTIAWRGGRISSFINGGTGSDTLDIFGVNAGGTAFQAWLLGIDGGDDASSTDGQIDTLNLHGVVEVLSDLRNWEAINLVDNSRADLGSVSRTITTEQFSIQAGSALFASSIAGGQEYTINGNLLNDGAINMQSPAPRYDVVGATGTYTGGAGSLLALDTFLGANGSPSDLLRVGTATAGNTGLVINDTNAGPGAYNPLGIEVVRVESGATGNTQADDFTLIGGPIKKDLWTYDLGLDATRSNPGRANADVHVLYSRPGEEVQFTPYLGTGALTAFNSSLDPWIDRQQALADAIGSNNLTSGSLKDQPVKHSGTYVDLWATPFTAWRQEDSTSTQSFFGNSFSTQMDYKQATTGFQAGVDIISIRGPREAFMGGMFGGFLNSSISPETISLSADFEGGTVGGYAAYVRDGLTLSALAKVDFLDLDWKAHALNLDASTDVNTIGGRIEAAYKHPFLSGGSWLEPYANVTYAQSSWDQFSVLATTFAIDDNDSMLGRFGLRIGGDVRGPTNLARLFVGAGMVYDFDSETTAKIVSGGSTLPLSHDFNSTSLELQGGMKFEDIASGLSVSFTSSGRFSEDIEEYGGKATMNYRY
jgi:outer membrane autotransporter protein